MATPLPGNKVEIDSKPSSEFDSAYRRAAFNKSDVSKIIDGVSVLASSHYTNFSLFQASSLQLSKDKQTLFVSKGRSYSEGSDNDFSLRRQDNIDLDKIIKAFSERANSIETTNSDGSTSYTARASAHIALTSKLPSNWQRSWGYSEYVTKIDVISTHDIKPLKQ